MAAKRRPVKRTAELDAQWRNRIVDYGEVTAAQLEANPLNPKIHDLAQRQAMSAILDDVGFVAPIVVNRLTMRIVDGHMRAGLVGAKGGKIPVAYVELTPEEEREVLLLLDPIGAMATYDPDAVATIMANLPGSVDTAQVLEGLYADDVEVHEPRTVTLQPLGRAHVLISVPLDRWDEVADMLDQIGDIDDVDITSTVN